MAWQDLAAQYPGTFDADVGDADMPLKLAEIVETLRDTDLAAQEFEMQRDGLLEDLQQKVYDGYWQVSTLRTVADIWKGWMDAADEAGKTRMEKQAKSYQRQIDELVRVKNNAMANLKKARKERDEANAERIKSVRELRKSKKKAIETLRKNWKKATEGRHKTAERRKIEKTVRELEKLLLKGDKKKHVKEGMASPGAQPGPLFVDVQDDAWYYGAVSWASGEGIVQGVGDYRFAPEDGLLRRDAVCLLYRWYSKV